MSDEDNISDNKQLTTFTHPVFEKFVGINVYADLNSKLFSKTFSQVRNYHPLRFDVRFIGDTAYFRSGPEPSWAKTVYTRWTNDGLEIDASLELRDFLPRNCETYNQWFDSTWLINYGYKLAKLKNTNSKKHLISSLEIGNEPGTEFDDTLYSYIAHYLAIGARRGNLKIRILTCNIHLDESDRYSKNVNDIVLQKDYLNFDVLSTHLYAFKNTSFFNNTPNRSFPEDPKIDFLNKLDRIVYWRNANSPKTPIWITEFGWDAPSDSSIQNKSTTNPGYKGVTDLEQAQFLVRSVLLFSSKQVERVYIYYYKDFDVPDIHSSSGIIRNTSPKKSFYALRQMMNILREYKFSKVIKKVEGRIYALEFAKENNPDQKVLCVWSPTLGKDEVLYEISINGNVSKIQKMATSEINDVPFYKINTVNNKLNILKIRLSENPIYISYTQ